MSVTTYTRTINAKPVKLYPYIMIMSIMTLWAYCTITTVRCFNYYGPYAYLSGNVHNCIVWRDFAVKVAPRVLTSNVSECESAGHCSIMLVDLLRPPAPKSSTLLVKSVCLRSPLSACGLVRRAVSENVTSDEHKWEVLGALVVNALDAVLQLYQEMRARRVESPGTRVQRQRWCDFNRDACRLTH